MAVGRYLLAWFPMVLIAVGNGAFRESILRPQFGKLHARQLSTLLLIALFAVYVWIVVRVSPIESGRQAAVIGLACSCSRSSSNALDRFVSGQSWREVAADYNLAAGRLWVLVPIWIAVAPYVFYRLQVQA